ncbi:MAG: hypothetical protein SPL54_00455 [Lachnospiraceae bacterium]|nr:hypothetical protein [Lachnospiraceae bacterium]
MTSYNSVMMGDEIELSSEQLYFFDSDTHRRARTAKLPKTIRLSAGIVEGDKAIKVVQSADDDESIYEKPYQEGDLVALISMPDGRYLVLGKIVQGESITSLDEQTEKDWA